MKSLIKAKDLLSLNQKEISLIEIGKYEFYKENHLENSIFIDLDKELSNIKENYANGGRHPLPNFEDFLILLGKKGIKPNTHLVVYDRSACAMGAARFWWMMKALGHAKIQVLDGGFSSAERIGFPMQKSENTILQTENYKSRFSNWQLKNLSLEEVRNGILEKKILLIDVRSKERYDGIVEPIDLVAGHIPTAINLPYTDHLTKENEYFSKSKLMEKYNWLDNQEKEVVVYCGSGVSACHLLLAFDVANFTLPSIYMGSWSEWSRN